MSALSVHAVGTFCWPELCSADAPESKRFYRAIFGWDAEDQHMPEGDYTLFKMGAENAGAVYEMKPERQAAGVGAHWNLYVAVADAAATCRNCTELGGTVRTKPFEAGDNLLANLEDPTGAKFCIWQARKEPVPTRLNEIGALGWSELYTNDTKRAADFYTGLFGWSAKPWQHLEEPFEAPYTMFHHPTQERPVGGMLAITYAMPGDLPHWLPYFRVGDADATAKQVHELGGIILQAPVDIPSVGRMAMFADVQGALFAVIRLH